MFELVLNATFTSNDDQLTSFYMIRIFTETFFSKQTIKIWILILINPRNIFKLHAKKIYTKTKENKLFVSV